MALPTSAAEVQMMMTEWERHRNLAVEVMSQIFYPRLFDLLYKRIFLQRPHTDDMMQMCTDLGVDVPDFQRVSADGLTFRWR